MHSYAIGETYREKVKQTNKKKEKKKVAYLEM